MPAVCRSCRSRIAVTASLALLCAVPAAAQPTGLTPSAYLQANWARHDTQALTLGATLPWRDWSSQLWGGELRGYWDMYLSRWSFDGLAGHESTTLLGITPTLRLWTDPGKSPWFWEAGIGATLASERYQTPRREFSTRFNFASHLGLGLQLGAQGQHELQLRLQHVSNAGIKKPNPGENFLQLRYAVRY